MAKEEVDESEAKPSETAATPQSAGKKRTIAVTRNGKSDEAAEGKRQKTVDSESVAESDGGKDAVVTNDTIQALADELGLADEEEIHPPSPQKKETAANHPDSSKDGATAKPRALSSQAGLRRTDGIRGRLDGVGGRADGVRGRGANVFAAVVAEATRVDPPPQDPTPILRMEGLRRPFTEKQLRELLAETGEVTWFWINRIKSLAFAEFRSDREADATRRALYDLQARRPSPFPRRSHQQPLSLRACHASMRCSIESPVPNPEAQ
jgi:apoptotic chromatin condensation inducer in the nucleus